MGKAMSKRESVKRGRRAPTSSTGPKVSGRFNVKIQEFIRKKEKVGRRSIKKK